MVDNCRFYACQAFLKPGHGVECPLQLFLPTGQGSQLLRSASLEFLDGALAVGVGGGGEKKRCRVEENG